ncbi:MAG: bifunctional serine/threonine-protein kinase/formylglycine-generating enzyme family protein [bacterium]
MENRILNNRYKLEAEIGRGGMGVVYRAIDIQLHRTVAIKILPPEFVHNTQFLARFNSEIRNTSQLEHQNIVSVYDVGVDDNTNYYVMQYVDGQDLKAYLAQHGRLSVAETCRILGQIANALDYAHARGIVHRDIKPENILIDRQGVPNLTDFGIARSLEGTRMTTGMVGTPEYMSPEQAKGEDVCGRSDQYSLAIVAYEMLTGTTPFRSSTGQPWAIINKHINEPPADPRIIVPDLDGNAAGVVMIGLAKVIGERHSTCVKFIETMKHNNATVKMTVISSVKLKTNPNDGAEMILIPMGEFLMGSAKTDKNALKAEMPQREVNLDAYYIYKTEVTVAQYRKFCTATGRKMPNAPDWGWQNNHPIVNVNWNDAKAYADWAGVALPTEAQWEKAARGTDGRIYPWGNEWDNSKLQCSKVKWGDAGKTAPVGSFSTGASPYGVMDMTGNVWEWCADWYGADYYKNAPTKNPDPVTGGCLVLWGGSRVLRGGSWGNYGGSDFRGAYRYNYYPYGGGNIIGFRCVSPGP